MARCKQYTVRAHFVLMRILSACLSQLVVTVVQGHTATQSRTLIPRTTRGSRTTEHFFVSFSKTVTLRRAISYVTPYLTTPSTCTPSLSTTPSSRNVLLPPLSEHKPGGDLRPHLSGALAEPPSFTSSHQNFVLEVRLC